MINYQIPSEEPKFFSRNDEKLLSLTNYIFTTIKCKIYTNSIGHGYFERKLENDVSHFARDVNNKKYQ